MKRLFVIFFFVLAVLLTSSPAQELKVTQMKMGPDGSLDWYSGAAVSQNGVSVKFEADLDKDGRIVSYRHEKAGLDKVKTGDRIALYITRIKVSGSFGDFRDASGAKVWHSPGRQGGWRVVTIESIVPTASGVTVKLKEKLTLEKSKDVSELVFQLKEGYLADITDN